MQFKTDPIQFEHWYVVNNICVAFLGERPDYCDRGRYHAVLEIGVWRSDADHWPRYYFDLDRAKAEILEYLNGKMAKGSVEDKRFTTFDGGKWVKMRLEGEKMVEVNE